MTLHELPFVNFYDDTIKAYDESSDEDYFKDLSNMETYYKKTRSRLNSKYYTYAPSSTCEDLNIFCLVNKFNQNVESFGCFYGNHIRGVDSIVTYVLNRIKDGMYDFVYSSGIFVKTELRKKGIGKEITIKSLAEFKHFLSYYGPNLHIGPIKDCKYLIEAVVDKGNIASNKLSQSLKNSSTTITEEFELYTNQLHYIYSDSFTL